MCIHLVKKKGILLTLKMYGMDNFKKNLFICYTHECKMHNIHKRLLELVSDYSDPICSFSYTIS